MKPKKNPPVWRTLLYVPTNASKFVEKAHTRGADAIQLDLEDSVPGSEKERARSMLPEAAKLVRRGGADVVVRINRPLALAVADITASVLPEVDAIAVTKAQSADHVRLLDELVTDLETQRGMEVGRIRFIVMVETPQAFQQIGKIAAATERIVAMSIGGEDFALSCGMAPNDVTLLHPKQHMIIAAAAAGIMPIGFLSSVADYGDLDKFREMVVRSRQFGFQGACCIHPSQVPIVNEAYSPGADEVAFAQRLIAADLEAQKAGRGSFAIDGKMIDIPVVERARRLLERHEAIQRRVARAASFRA